jgi:dTDP-4-dehydrorhamnose reductase
VGQERHERRIPGMGGCPVRSATMKMLVTGRKGQVGFELVRAVAPLGEMVAVDRAVCDLSTPEAIRELVRSIAPDVILNPAAYTAVDKAESDPATASAVNTHAPRILGEEAARLTAARRAGNSRLDTTGFRETFGLRLPPWEEGVRHVLQQIF